MGPWDRRPLYDFLRSALYAVVEVARVAVYTNYRDVDEVRDAGPLCGS